jgi:hypothetical protein
VPLIKPGYQGSRHKVEWGRAVREMSQAIAADRPHRATGEQAAHVVEILNAVTQSMQTSQPVTIHSSFTSPAPMEWALG